MSESSRLQEKIQIAVAAGDREKLAALEVEVREAAASACDAELVECLVMLCTGWRHCDDLARSRALSSFAVEVARSCDDARSIRRALNVRAGAADAEGKLGLALRDLTEAHRIAATIGDKHATIQSLVNIATCCGRAGLLIHAQRCYEAARALVESTRSELTKPEYFVASCVVLTGSMDCSLGTGDLRQALQFGRHVRTLSAQRPKSMEAYDSYVANLFVEEAEFFELIALCRLKMLAEANTLGQALAGKLEAKSVIELNVPAARWALANLHAANGDVSTAISILEGLVDVPTIHQEVRADLASCLRQAGRDDEAISIWRELQSEIGRARQAIAMDELGLIDGIGANEDVLFERNIDMTVAMAEGENAFSTRLRAKIRLLADIAVSAELPELQEGVEQHVETVGRLAAHLASSVGCDSRQQWLADVAGRLHDVGKCAIPERLRLKPAGLSSEQLQLLRERSTLGARLVEASNERDLMPVADAIRSLHEHYDGSGYPAQLKGDEIPLLARVIAICEAFVAMTERRPYREALSLEAALNELSKGEGTQFDPLLCSAFAKLIRSPTGPALYNRKSSY